MKSLSLLLPLVCLAAASPVVLDQHAFQYSATEPGYHLDLGAQRLVQTEGQAPVWMTELDKVPISFSRLFTSLRLLQIKMKAQGAKFFDM